MFSFEDAARWTQGHPSFAPICDVAEFVHLTRGEAPLQINGVFTDTRETVPGALYIAIQGANFDGHTFVAQAMEKGACAVMVNVGTQIDPSIPALVVADTQLGLRDLAAGWRARVNPKMIGVTGSVGKTTVKEWTAHLLGALGPTARTRGNWNNELGLPKSLLTMSADTQYGVFETGMNHPGEIAPLANLLKPDCAIITNVGPVHLEFFDSVDAIAHEKAELLRALPTDGVAVVDADSTYYLYLAEQSPCRVISVSQNADSGADYVAVKVISEFGRFTVHDRATDEWVEIETGMPGVHHVTNALEALAMARHLGISWSDIQARFMSLPRLSMRWERIERNGVQWINDAYNANSVSMSKAVETFAGLHTQGRQKIVVLGDMFELGENEEALHRAVGRVVATSNVDVLVAVGERASKWIAGAAVEAGFDSTRIHRMADALEAREKCADLFAGASVLLKASRGMALERILSE